MEDKENVEEIEERINELKNTKTNLKKEERKEERNGKLRLKSNTNGKSNILIRVSNNFARRLDLINDKREENGYDRLSNPKINELIVKHIIAWEKIQEDIIFFNTGLELDIKKEERVYAK